MRSDAQLTTGRMSPNTQTHIHRTTAFVSLVTADCNSRKVPRETDTEAAAVREWAGVSELLYKLDRASCRGEILVVACCRVG